MHMMHPEGKKFFRGYENSEGAVRYVWTTCPEAETIKLMVNESLVEAIKHVEGIHNDTDNNLCTVE
jgi:hypothetical protein